MPSDPLTRGSALGPRWGLRPQTPTIQKKSPPLHNSVVQTTTNRSNGLKVTVDRRVVKSHDASIVVGVVNKLDRRRVLLTTRSTAKFSVRPEFGTKFQREVRLFLEMPEFPYTTLYDVWKKVSVLKTSSILPVVSIQYRLVTDGRTDRQTDRPDDSKCRARIASRIKNNS